MGAAVLALQRFAGDPAPYERITARAWIERRMGRQAWEEVWGPLLRGKFGERADQIAMVWLWSKLRLRRAVKGEDVRQERLGYPRGSLGAAARGARALDRGRRRAGADRPPGRAARRARARASRCTRGAPGSFRARPRPARVRRRRGGEATTACSPRCPTTSSSGCSTRRSPPRWGRPTSRGRAAIEYFAALCLLLELDRRFCPYYWTNVADRALPFVGLIEHTNFVEPERYGGRRFLYVANYLPHGHELLELDADALLARYEPGLRAVNPAFSRAWVRARGCYASRPRSRSSPSATRERIPPLRTPAAGPGAGQHDAGLSRGPRHELRGAARASRRRARCCEG